MAKNNVVDNNKKYVLVTGAYGGMGRAAVELFAASGYVVFAADLRVDEDESRQNVVPLAFDVTDYDSVLAALDKVSQITDKLYAVVHFAGIYMLNSLVEMPVEDFKRIVDINLCGAFAVNKAFVPMLDVGGRVVITTSELAPLDPLPFTGIYAVTKAALDKYAYSLCMELQLSGISVSVIRAGAVSTGMLGVSTAELDKFVAETTRYKCNAKRFKQIVDGVEAKSVPPQKIAQTAAKILTARKPKFVYNVNRNRLLLLLNALPKRMQLWAIRRVLK